MSSNHEANSADKEDGDKDHAACDDADDDQDKEEEEDGEGENDILGEEGDADGIRKKVSKERKCCSYIKSKWLVPLIKDSNAEQPNMSNKEFTHLLRNHARHNFLSSAILQTARQLARLVYSNEFVQLMEHHLD
jgi:hypothetical protein